MTIREIKQMNKEIRRLKSKLIKLRSGAVNISPSVSDAPSSSGVTDKLGAIVAEIADAGQELGRLIAERNAALDRLDKDSYEENCIWLHLARGWSWRKIATEIDGRPDTADCIRMRCRNYHW